MENLQELKAAIEEITEQINNPQSFVVSVQRDSADIQNFRSKMANLADALESRLREIEERSNPSVHIESSDWVNRLENRLREIENNLIKQVVDLRKEVKEVKNKIDELNDKFTNLLESYPTWRCVRTFNDILPKMSNCDYRYLFHLAISYDAQILAGIFYVDNRCNDYVIKLWNLNNGQEIGTFGEYSEGVSSLAFSRNVNMLAGGFSNGIIKLWDLASKQEICILEGHSNSVDSVSFSWNEEILVSRSDDSIILWDLVDKKEICTITDYSSFDFQISPDAKKLASFGCNYDQLKANLDHKNIKFKLWNITDKQEIYPSTVEMPDLHGIHPIAFSPDGQTLAILNDNELFDTGVRLLHLACEQESYTTIETSRTNASVAFSADGKTLAIGNYMGIIELWNWKTYEKICSLNGHSQEVNEVYLIAFSPDGKNLISCDALGKVKVWQQFFKPAFEVLGEKILEKLGESNRE